MKHVTLFLRESNQIENVWDEESLKDAKKAWDYLIKEIALTESNILECHRILMKRHLKDKELGVYRTVNVAIKYTNAEGKIIRTVPLGIRPKDVSIAMRSWINIANVASDSELVSKAFEELIKIQHISFENIHPFLDGNGRIGRMLLNWQRQKVGLPILVIKEKEKKMYYKWFDKSDWSNI